VTNDECRGLLAGILADVAPEADLGSVPAEANLRTELDLDSLDFLSLVEGVCDRTGVTIPERDYGRLGSISEWTAYLTERSAVGAQGQNP
jgi:acyl carrier protein